MAAAHKQEIHQKLVAVERAGVKKLQERIINRDPCQLKILASKRTN
jgi:hypothetical protein